MDPAKRAAIGKRIGYICIGLGVLSGILAVVQIVRGREVLPLIAGALAVFTIGLIMVAGAKRKADSSG